MKILSKYKDYYDYLSDIYGVDPLLVLDRREFDVIPSCDNEFIKLYICGYIIELYCKDGKFYCGDKLWQFDSPNKPIHSYKYSKSELKKLVYIEDEKYGSYSRRFEGTYIDPRIRIDHEEFNNKYDCPILLQGPYKDFHKYPILSELDIASFIPPEDMFKTISNWLSNKITIKENHIDNRSNNEKILSNGFDIKTSFRSNIKL